MASNQLPSAATLLGSPTFYEPTDIAIANFNSVPTQNAPFRDIPTKLMDHLLQPKLGETEPNWGQLLSYCTSPKAKSGPANLQDFYLLLVRCIIPNVIIENRYLLVEMYQKRGDLPVNCRLRYDAMGSMAANQAAIEAIPVIIAEKCDIDRNVPQNVDPRPIWRSKPTPMPNNIMNWVRAGIPNNLPTPTQVLHRVSEMDTYLSHTEAEVRTWPLEMLLRTIIRCLWIFWRLSINNHHLKLHQAAHWVNIDQAFQ